MTPLWSLTATELVQLIQRGDVSAREVTESTLSRIDAVNAECNAIVARCDDEARAAADAIDAARAQGLDTGPMAGVPVTIKVNTDQVGHATTNGLRRQRDLIATQDSPVVSNLRRAGAVIVGRSNTPAFSLRWFTRNSLHGHTTNPRAPGITPGGSSGGASAAVAAGMGPVAHGTDIAGSIRYPAYACGIHGLRPSLGRVPAFNTSAPDRNIGAQLMAVSGPLARSIPDLRLSLAAMAQPDLRDPWYTPAPLRGPTLPRRAALCLAPDGMEVDALVKDAVRAAASRLAAAGWQIDEVDTPPVHEAMRLQLILWLSEMRIGAHDAIIDEDDPDALAIYDYLQAIVPESEPPAVLEALRGRSRLMRQWRAFLSDYPVMLCPVSGELPFDDLRDVISQSEFEAIIAAQALQIGLPFLGLPGLSVATGTAQGRPVGVQLVANQFREDILLDAGDIIAGIVPTAL